MNWLDRLSEVFSKRTPGPWTRFLDTVQQSVSHEHPVRVCVMTGDTRAVFQSDQDFIALTGSCADEILAVLKETESLAEECRIVDESPCHQLVDAQRQALKAVDAALAALKVAVERGLG